MVDIPLEKEQYPLAPSVNKKPIFIRLVLATRVVSSDTQAEYVSLAFAIVGIIASVFLFSNSGVTQQKPTATAVEQMNQFMTTNPSGR